MSVQLTKHETITADVPLSIGWYGIPGGPSYRSTPVHVHARGHGPICGAKLSSKMQYQWCSHGVQREYIECGNCLRRVERAA
jgi:hypothetical protein